MNVTMYGHGHNATWFFRCYMKPQWCIVHLNAELFQVICSNCSASCVHRQLQVMDLSIDVFNEMANEAYQLLLDILLAMKVCDQKGDVIAINRHSTEYLKVFCPLHEEGHILFDQQGIKLISLPDLETDSGRIDRCFDQTLLVFITANECWFQNEL